MRRRTLVLAAVLVAVQAALVSSVFVAAPHPGGDNAAYLSLAHSILQGDGYTEAWDPAAPPHTKYPPVFPLLIAVTMALGARGWGALKAAPVVMSLVGVVAVFLWARRRVRDEVAFGVALLTGLSAAYLDHSRWILSDVPFVAFLFLALWALERLLPVPRSGWTGVEVPGPEGAGAAATAEERRGPGGELEAAAADVPGSAPAWRRVALPVAAATTVLLLALLTRSAGLPLAVAAVAASALRGRWRVAGIVGGAAALVGGAWALRARLAAGGQGAYQSEFRLLDPYQPDLGTAGAGDFVRRVVDNLSGYLQTHGARTLFDGAGGGLTFVAVSLVGLACVGWFLHLRRAGVAEIFVPLYVGLILVWPQVWSGARFALPLVPLVLLYAARGVSAGAARIRGLQPGVPLLVGGLVLGVLAGWAWTDTMARASSCRAAVDAAGPWSCAGAPTVDFVTAARFSGAALPPGSVALTRKPRIWYLRSGIPTRTYPFSEADGALLEAAESAGARYVVLDAVGSQGLRYVGTAVVSRPGSFCGIQAFGRQEAPTQLLGIVPGDSGSRRSEVGLELAPCPPTMAGDVAGARAVFEADPELRRIPLLDDPPRGSPPGGP